MEKFDGKLCALSFDPKVSVLTVNVYRSDILGDLLREIVTGINKVNPPGGQILRINGTISGPAGLILGRMLGLKYPVVAVWDPLQGQHVVAISNISDRSVGDYLSD